MRWGIAGIMLCAGIAFAAAAQDGARNLTPAGTAPTSIVEERQALRVANAQADQARARSIRLDAQAQQATQAADRARSRAAALAARIQESEADIAAGKARLAIIARLQRAQAARLAERQQPIVRLIAALQSLARRPSALALVQPGSVDDAVHMRLVLDSVLPVIATRTAGLRAELAKSRQLRSVAEKASRALDDGRTRLAARQADLRRLENEQRIASRDFASSAGLESDRAVALGERARDIVDLMDQLEQAGAVRTRLESLPGPALRPLRPGEAALPRAEMPASADRPPPYRLPVDGQLVTGLGEISTNGVRARGLTIAPAAGGQVVAPTSGRIVFAGHYRGYGQIAIIDHGQGWTTLITGMHRLSVQVGNSVVQGSPLGVAGPGRPTVTVELRRNGRPIDIVPLIAS